MGRYYALLDPPYPRTDEPGWMWSWRGGQVLRAFAEEEYHARFAATAYNPPGTDWILPRPRQWNPDWYRDAGFTDALLGKDLWTFASGISAVDFEHTKVGGETNYPSNKWIALPFIPEAVASLDTTNYAALETLTGLDVGGFKTVAMCGQTPVGGSLIESYQPAFQCSLLPPPYDKLIFGWGRFCFVLTPSTFHFCENVDGTRQSWRLLASGQLGGGAERAASWYRLPNRSLTMNNTFRLTNVTVVALQVDPTEVFLHLIDGSVVPVTIQGGLRANNAVWWIGAAPKQHVVYQAQVVRYNDLELPGGPIVGGPYHFDLGDYAPTADSRFRAWGAVHVHPGGTGTTETITSNQYSLASSYTNQQLLVELTDDQGDLWVSNGVRTKGGIRVKLFPGNQGIDRQYLTPMFRLAELRFPAVLTTRENTPLTLDDTEFAGWTWEGNLRDPLSVKGELRLWDLGVQVLVNAGLDHRDQYPIEIWEDTDGDGTPDVKRLAGWVTDPQLTIHATEDQPLPGGGTRADPLQYYSLGFEGLLVRAEARWEFPPQMVNPDLPYITHYGAVGEALFGRGFDTGDPAAVFIYTPTHGDTTLEALPGSPAERASPAGFEDDAWYRPNDEQTALAYCELIREKFSGWLLYQRMDGRINYHPDLPFEHLLAAVAGASGKYFRSATIYKSHADAATALVPGQCVLADGFERTFVQPTANIVRVTGQSLNGGSLINVRDRAPETWTTPANENFTGDRRPDSKIDKLVVTPSAAWRLARLTLMQKKRRLTVHHGSVPLAPWAMSHPLDLGEVVEFKDRGDHLVTFARVEGHSRGYVVSRWSGEKLPTAMTRSMVEGGYPGQGA